MGNLVAGVADGADDVGPPLRGVAGNEERGPHRRGVQEPEDARHGRPRAVFLVAHDVELGPGLRVVRQHHRLGVDVERETGGGPLVVRPAEAGRQSGRHGEAPIRRRATSESIS
jgi:hypothetical protein